MEEKEDKEQSECLRVHILFYDMVAKYMYEFKKKNGYKISTTNATKIIHDKIISLGGLVV